MWQYGDNKYSEDEVVGMLNSKDFGLVFLDGPSGCGKTNIIKTICPNEKLIVNSEFASNVIAEYSRSGGNLYEIAYSKLSGNRVVCLEDIDLMLRGRPSTSAMIRDIVNTLCLECLVVITGINIRNRVPELSEPNSIYCVWNEELN